MPVTFAFNSVLDRLRASIVATLTAQDEPPSQLPGADSAQQVALLASELPLTVLQYGSSKISQDDCPANSQRFCQPVIIHHLRALAPGGSASDIATSRLSAIGAALFVDYRLASVSVDGDASIEMVRVVHLARGEDNPVQMILDANDQDAGIVAAALHVEIDWTEDA